MHTSKNIQRKQEQESHGLQSENKSQRKLTKIITWIIALCNSMKLWAMLFRATQDRWVILETSAKHGPLKKGMENHFIILSLRTPRTPEQYEKANRYETGRWVHPCPRSIGVQHAIVAEWGKKHQKEWRVWTKVEMKPSCGCVWWWK